MHKNGTKIFKSIKLLNFNALLQPLCSADVAFENDII